MQRSTKKYIPLKWKSSVAAVAILVLGLSAACAVAYYAMGEALESATTARVSAATKQGMSALDDVKRRVDAYALLISRRGELAGLVEDRNYRDLEPAAVAEFKFLHAIDSVVATLEVTDDRGVVIMRGHNPSKKGDDKSKSPQVRSALDGNAAAGLTVSSSTGEAAQDAVYPLKRGGKVVGSIKVGAYFRSATAAEIKQLTGADIIFVLDGAVKATTLGKDVDVKLTKELLAGSDRVETLRIGDRSFLAQFAHRASDVGQGMTIGFLADRVVIANERAVFTTTLLVVGAIVVMLLAPIIVLATARFTGRLLSLVSVIRRVSEGQLDGDIPCAGDPDEIGQIATAVASLRDGAIEKNRLEQEAVVAERAATAARAKAEEEAVARERSIVASSIGMGMTKLASKDLTFRLSGLPDAYHRLQADFNTAMGELEGALFEVSQTAASLEASTHDIRSSATDLSRRTEQQASSLEETAAALDQITATGKKAAEGANHARSAVATAKVDSEDAGSVVREAVTAMGSIEQSSRKITQIIGVIDEIAFQTNLLALNAGVEAARAGDAGRGFAVVASEVRALAQRSANAAKEIKALITASSTQVADGAALVSKTGEALGRITLQVNGINQIVVDIAAGAQEQATGLQQVNSSINQMDQVTQQNAAMVEQTTNASEVLARAGSELNALISAFHLSERRERGRRAA